MPPATPGCCLNFPQRIAEKYKHGFLCTLCGIWVNTSRFAGKDNNKIVFRRCVLVTFLNNFQFLLGYLYFPGDFFDTMYGKLTSCGNYSLPYELYRKVTPVVLTLLFLLFILYIPIFEHLEKKII